MVRVLVSTSPESQDRIIKATNRQSGISAAQLHATEQVHRDIEKMFPAFGLYYDRRLKYWKYKDKPRDQVVSIQALSQSLMAIYEQRPDTARGRPGDVFSKKNVALYSKLFDPSTSLNVYVACAQIQRVVEKHLKEAKLSRALINDTKFYVSMIVSVRATGKVNPAVDDLAKLSVSSITGTMIDDAYKTAYEAYANNGGADEDASKGSEMLAEIKSRLAIV